MATFKTVTVRTTLDEAKLIQAGAAALGISPSTLVSTAALSASHRLGFFEDRVETQKAEPGSWKDKPNRGEESFLANRKRSEPDNPKLAALKLPAPFE